MRFQEETTMNHFKAREIADASGQGTRLYRYTRRNDEIVMAVGYCACDPESGGGLCPGHPTPEAAEAHHKAWLLDHAARYGLAARVWRPCAICDELTSQAAEVEAQVFSLCALHHDRYSLEKLLQVGECWTC
jgi:hypothetical protein